jgi:hypothetical protein
MVNQHEQQTNQLQLTPDNWWDVVPGRSVGATPLVERCKRRLVWTDAFAKEVLAAYKDFIACKFFLQDWDATLLSPSLSVDQMWHHHVLDTKNYASDCQILVSHVLHHNPDGDVDPTARAPRVERTKSLIAQRKGQEALSLSVWNFGDTPPDNADDDDDNNHVDRPSRRHPRRRPRRREAADEESVERASRRRRAEVSRRGVQPEQPDPADPATEEAEAENVTILSERARREQNDIRLYSERLDANRAAIYQALDLPNGVGPTSPITFSVRDQTGDDTLFNIDRCMRFAVVFIDYANRKEVDMVNFRFLFHGERVRPEQTPHTLELQEQDHIDCILAYGG